MFFEGIKWCINIINGEYTIPVAEGANYICEWREYWTEDGYWYGEDACGYDVVIEHWNFYDGIAPVSKTYYEGIQAPSTLNFYFQTVTGGIEGTVTDENGDPLKDAWIVAHSLDSTDYVQDLWLA